MIMKMKYIKPVILCCYDIDMSIIAATARVTAEGVSDSEAKFGDGLEVGGPTETPPPSTKGTSWNLWEDEEENSFY